MNRTGLFLIALLGLPASANAACDSPTANLKTRTVAFMCPAEAMPQEKAVEPSATGNVSVVKKVVGAVPDLPLPSTPADDLEADAVDETASITPVPAENPIKTNSSAAKPDKKAKSKSKSRSKAKSKSKKSKPKSKAKSGQIIHLEKPSLGRRIIQFFGG